MSTTSDRLFGIKAPEPGLKPPQERTFYATMDHLAAGKNVIIQSPTGSGKTRLATELLRDGGIFYVNRKSLVKQTRDSFELSGLDHGVRAAEHEDGYDPAQPVQIASADTERHRVFGPKATWNQHKTDLVVVDEAHIQKGDTMKRILDDHMSRGAAIVLLSATPVGLHSMIPNSELVVGGTIKEFQKCGLLVPATVRSIQQPDLRKVKRNQTGEYILDGKVKKLYTQSIVGSVLDRWKLYNPDARPTMLYAPGKSESVWFTEQFHKAGVSWCHVDASEAYYDGKRRSLTRPLWEEILGKYRDGTFKGISSRFKLREGVDVPSTYQIILATPIGSLSSYLQTVGRGLRSALGKDSCVITDHGGNYLRHGSPNMDRDWELLVRMSNHVASSMHERSIREKEIPEPIRCSNCEGERLKGLVCPHCGEVAKKSVRNVIQRDGRMIVVDGPLIPKRHRKTVSDTQAKWDRMYFAFKNKKVKRTFSQMEAFFVKENHYWPSRSLNNMPTTSGGWYSYVYSVPRKDLKHDES